MWRTGADVVLVPEVMVVAGPSLVVVDDVTELSVVVVDSEGEVVELGGSVEVALPVLVVVCSSVVVRPAVVEAGVEVEDESEVVDPAVVLAGWVVVDSVEDCSGVVVEDDDESVVDCAGEVEDSCTEVDEEDGGVVDDELGMVLLLFGVSSCLLAIWTIAEATEGSSPWIASMASRSEGKTPCWYLSGR